MLRAARAWAAAPRPPATARLLAAGGYLPVVLCGRNERLLAQLAREPAALPLGWVDDMPGLLAACYALVDNAAGQTAVQALATGLPVIGHRPLPGHGADGVRRMADLGLSELAPTGPALLAALARLREDTAQRRIRVARGRALFRRDALDCVTDL
ncbi:hypothetical protein [Streptomyces tricolor]